MIHGQNPQTPYEISKESETGHMNFKRKVYCVVTKFVLILHSKEQHILHSPATLSLGHGLCELPHF